MLEVNKSNFDSVLKSDKPVLIDFWASWCGPCRMVAPTIEKIAEENPQYLVCKVNVDDSMELAQQYGVESIPTLVVLKNGQETGRMVGVRPEEQILDMLKK